MIRLRMAEPADLDRLVAIEDAAFAGDRLSRRSLKRYVGAPSAAMIVALVDGAVGGYGLMGLRRGGRAASLYSIAVDPALCRRGVGRLLLQACEREAAARGRTLFTLEVRADNAAAIALYQRLGYENYGSIADYYEDGEAALRFRKPLSRPRPLTI